MEDTSVKKVGIPEPLFEGTWRELAEQSGLKWELRDEEFNGFTLRFFEAVLPENILQTLKETLREHSVQQAKHDPSLYIFVGEASVVTTEHEEHPLCQPGAEYMLEEIRDVCSVFSECSGYEVVLHLPETDFLVPQRTSDKQISLILGASPPGSSEIIKRTVHPETGISYRSHDLRYTCHSGAAPGWGHVVMAKDDKPIAQIIGRNLYLFVPTDKFGIKLLPDGENAGLFEYAFRHAWNAFMKNPPPPEEKSVATEEEFRHHLCLVSAFEPAQLFEEIGAVKEDLDSLREQYKKKLNKLRQLEVLASHDMQHMKQVLTVPAPWESVLHHPLFEKMSVVAHALHVRTKSVVYEGYLLGAYVIRFECEPISAIWRVVVYSAEEPLHPQNIIHPHIGKDGCVCFGNVGLLIDEALMQQRIPDAISLTLQWLANGYDPEIARHKLEEWPRVETPALPLPIKEVA